MRRAIVAAFVAGAIAALAVAVILQMQKDRRYPRDQQQALSVMYVKSGPALRRIALEYDAVAADVYWIRAIQHYGGDRLAGTGSGSTSCSIRCSTSRRRSTRSSRSPIDSVRYS